MAFGGHFGHTQLMRDHVDARRQHAPARMPLRIGATAQEFMAEIELVAAIQPPGHQPRIGLRYRLLRIELSFVEALAGCGVGHQAGSLLHAFDQPLAPIHAHGVANAKLGACQRCGFESVLTHHAGAGEYDLHGAASEPHHGAKAQFGFGGGEPALPGNKTCRSHPAILSGATAHVALVLSQCFTTLSLRSPPRCVRGGYGS